MLTFAFESCHSQDTTKKPSPTRLNISKERSDSLALHVPPTRGFINDFVQFFTKAEIKTLDSLVSAFERTTTVEISVATVSETMVREIDFEDYSLVMMRLWGVGKKGKNNGILIVISPDLRQMRIQNGYGLGSVLPDAETKDMVDYLFIPKFKEGKYFEGIRNGIVAIIDKLKQNGL